MGEDNATGGFIFPAQKYSLGSEMGIFLKDFQRDVSVEKSGTGRLRSQAMAGAEPLLPALITEVITEQHQALKATVRMVSLSKPKIPSTIPFYLHVYWAPDRTCDFIILKNYNKFQSIFLQYLLQF